MLKLVLLTHNLLQNICGKGTRQPIISTVYQKHSLMPFKYEVPPAQ